MLSGLRAPQAGQSVSGRTLYSADWEKNPSYIFKIGVGNTASLSDSVSRSECDE